MNKDRIIGALLLLLIAVAMIFLTISGAFGKKEPMVEEIKEEQEDENLIVVGFSQVGSESVWRTTHTRSLQEALSKENGFFLQYSNARQKQENQIKAIRGFISQRVDYIVFSPATEDGWETVLTEAKDAGIPVILVDRKIAESESDLYTTWVGSDMTEEGLRAGQWLAYEQARRGRAEAELNIVVLKGTIDSTSERGRTEGFERIARNHDNWNILCSESGDFTTSKGKEVMAQLLKHYPDIDVVVSQNDEMTFGAMEAIREAGLATGIHGRITIISFDSVKEALELVAEGSIDCDIECNPLQGELVAEIIKKLERGEKVEKEYFVEEKVFTRANVKDYLDERLY